MKKYFMIFEMFFIFPCIMGGGKFSDKNDQQCVWRLWNPLVEVNHQAHNQKDNFVDFEELIRACFQVNKENSLKIIYLWFEKIEQPSSYEPNLHEVDALAVSEDCLKDVHQEDWTDLLLFEQKLVPLLGKLQEQRPLVVQSKRPQTPYPEGDDRGSWK